MAVERSIPFGEEVVHHCITIEGNTNKAGEREGRYTLQRLRRLSTQNATASSAGWTSRHGRRPHEHLRILRRQARLQYAARGVSHRQTLAYDAGRELLWSVCPKCRAWNLSHLETEEQKRAIARLEERYAAAGTRLEKPPLGIARVGTHGTIYKVGASGWRQFAAWRYGERMLRQRWVWYGRLAISVVFAAVIFSDPVDRVLDGWGIWLLMLLTGAIVYFSHRWVLLRGPDVSGNTSVVRNADVIAAKIAGHRDDWTLTVGGKEPKIRSCSACALGRRRAQA